MADESRGTKVPKSGRNAGMRRGFGMSQPTATKFDLSSPDAIASARLENSGTQHRIGATPIERAGLDADYQPGYGRQSSQQTRGSLMPQARWDAQFMPPVAPAPPVVANPSGSPDAPASEAAPTAPPVAPSAVSGPVPQIVPHGTIPASAAGSMASNVAGSRAVGEEFAAGHPFVPTAGRTFIPPSLTSPMGNALTDAADLKQNMALASPSDSAAHRALVAKYAPAPVVTDPAANANTQRYAGTGLAVATPYGTVGSRAAQAGETLPKAVVTKTGIQRQRGADTRLTAPDSTQMDPYA